MLEIKLGVAFYQEDRGSVHGGQIDATKQKAECG